MIGWILGVANFGFNYLRHFFINFKNSCAHLVANFLKFLKLPKHFKFACFSRMLWTKPQKIRNRKICQFEPTLKSNLLGDWDFSTFFQSDDPKVPEWKIAHIEWSKKVQNIRKSPKNEGFRGTYLIPPFWEHPVCVCRRNMMKDLWNQIKACIQFTNVNVAE